MEVVATEVFEWNWEQINRFKVKNFTGTQKECKQYCLENNLQLTDIIPENRWIVNQGGSRSSKNYSIAQALILFAMSNPNEVISVLRKNRSTVKNTAMKDYIEVLKAMGIYKRNNHNLSDYSYTFSNGSIIEFFGVDNADKVMGRKRTICHVSEATEFWEEDILQLELRTSKFFICDFNPKEASSWVYDIPDSKKIVFKSTYLMNKFLSQAQIDDIEFLQETDPAMYTIFALGERAETRENVYTSWHFVKERPAEFKNYIYGIDFGMVHPTAFVRIWYTENSIFIEDLIYESGISNSDKLAEMIKAFGVGTGEKIVADYARPEIIKELRVNGLSVIEGDKAVKAGIDAMRRIKVYTSSQNVWKEYQGYKWKKVAGKLTEEVIKNNDDIMDAVRYANMYIKKHYRGNQQVYTFT